MAEVLQVPRTPDGQSYYQSSGLRRSHPSSSSLFLGSPALSSSPKSTPDIRPAEHQERVSTPPASTTLAAPDQPAAPTLSSLLSNHRIDDDDGDDFNFPDYGGLQFSRRDDDHDTSNTSSGDEPEASTTTDTTASDSPLPTPTVADDTAIKQEPKHHVDYLSHEWREEDIWASWRHIVSQRRVYGQRSRLENASWRTWAKSKYHLRTVSPETLNWLKESDVTWLYGPLKPAESHPITSHQSEPNSRLSRSDSGFINKKPILKKRSMSEVMLQKSLSTSSLVKQAAFAAQAQQAKQAHSHPKRAAFHRAHSDFGSSTWNSEASSRDQLDYFTSRSSSSESGTPCDCGQGKNRHIRFDDKVEQCIAVDVKEDAEEDDDADSEPDDPNHHDFTESSDTSSDDGVIMMARRRRRAGLKKKRGAGSGGCGNGSRSGSRERKRMVETLPATTLKYRKDSPGAAEAAQHHTFGRNWTPKLSPSPSQETLRPSHPSSNFLLHDDDAEAEIPSSTWSFGANNPKSSLGAASPTTEDEPSSSSSAFRFGGRKDSVGVHKARSTTAGPSYSDDFSEEGLRRTGSGMLMPYSDEDEDDMMAVGLFGKVSETINTAKDIAHVIWNVGWRK